MTPKPGTAYLIGAGPGAADLITVRALRLLRRADVVIHDRLIDPALLDETRADAVIIDAGKAPGRHAWTQDRINGCITDHARRGRSVVRLKGGDPFVFGRGGEELDACRNAGIPCVVVPGVTSAIAAPAAAGIPVTYRQIARSFAVVTARTDSPDGDPDLDYAALARLDTLVVMMGRANLRKITQALIDAGRDPSTPAACIERATTADQRVTVGTIATIADAADRDCLQPPMVTVIGATAAYADVANVAAVHAGAIARNGSTRRLVP